VIAIYSIRILAIEVKNWPPDIIILNKQQKQAYLLDIAVPNSHNITQTYRVTDEKPLMLYLALFFIRFE
jgi:uncharacterized protein YeaC (DUF1315 family)